MNNAAPASAWRPRALAALMPGRFREFLAHHSAGEKERLAWLWSMLLFACIAAVLPQLPLVACLLVIQWIFSSAFRRVIAATMLSLIAAYLGVVYLTVQELWTIPWLESTALLVSIAVGFLGRSRHEHVVLGLFQRNTFLERLVSMDELTGVYSRRHIVEFGRRELQCCQRTGLSLVVLLMEAGNFKDSTGVSGQAAGEQGPIDLRTAFQSGLRPLDMVGRYGADRFLILLVDTKWDDALETALRLQRLVAARETAGGNAQVNSSVSIGLAPLCADTVDFDGLVAEADNALNRAKVTGRNRVCWNNPDTGHADASQLWPRKSRKCSSTAVG